jgi:chromosome condensin MukBEF MukE localization factor
MVALAHLYGRFASHMIGSNSTKLRISEILVADFKLGVTVYVGEDTHHAEVGSNQLGKGPNHITTSASG